MRVSLSLEFGKGTSYYTFSTPSITNYRLWRYLIGARRNTDWQGAQIREALEEGMVELNDRERLVLSLHYGWDGHPPQTFAEISEPLGLTRQRMHQIHNEALLLLRIPALSIRLRNICQLFRCGLSFS
jgi:hypothetical protein